MHTDRETTRIVRSWLEEGRTALPDYVLDAVLDQLPATPQRRSSWPARRIPDMNVYAKLAMGAAAVLVAAVVGINFLLPGAGVGPGGPGPTPSPTPPPTPIPTVPEDGALAPGRYAWTWPRGSMSLQVPAGWTSRGWGISKHSDRPGEITFGVSLPGSREEVTHVYTDACRSAGALAPIGPTVDDLAQALDDQEATDAKVSDIVLDGNPGNRIDVAEAPGVDRSQCRHGDDGPLQIWANPAETGFYALAPEHTGTVIVVDVNGDRVVFSAASAPEASESDIAEFEAMIDSIEFTP